jgi:hypothetical protein
MRGKYWIPGPRLKDEDYLSFDSGLEIWDFPHLPYFPNQPPGLPERSTQTLFI